MTPKAIPILAHDDVARFWDKVHQRHPNDCWVWKASVTQSNGYGQFSINGRMVGAHRVAYFLGTGRQPRGLHVLHGCDNKRCCNPAHLFLGTNQDNKDDYVAKGLGPNLGHDQVGVRNGNVRLTEDDVRAIRAAEGIQRIIAARYGISQVMVSRIRLRKAWRHV
jgi:hypothetical protein